MNSQRISIALSCVFLPPNRVDNVSLVLTRDLQASPAEIERIGRVRVRRFVDDGPLSALSESCVRSFVRGPFAQPDLLLHVSTTPDSCSPAAAHRLHSRLNLPNTTLAMDVASSCTSFLSALMLASPWVEAHEGSALIVSAEAKSRHLRRGDIRLCGLFGDGAAAMRLEAPLDGSEKLLWIRPLVDSSLAENIRVEESSEGAYLVMREAKLMYRKTVRALVEVIERSLEEAKNRGLRVRRVFVHQANGHLLAEVKSSCPGRFLPVLISDVGNLVSASLPAHRARALVLEAILRTFQSQAPSLVPDQHAVVEWLESKGYCHSTGGICSIGVNRGKEWIVVQDGSGRPHWIGDLSAEEWSDFLMALDLLDASDKAKNGQKDPCCDLWVGAGGGFQAFSALHVYEHDGASQLTKPQ